MKIHRRDALTLGGTALATSLAGLPASAAAPVGSTPANLSFSLNTSTIRGQNLSVPDQVAVAAEAGYRGFEPWVRDLQTYRESGGDLNDLKKQIADAGLEVCSAIGFANWIVDDPSRRREALEVARRDMELVRAIGGSRIAAPPAGATDQADLDLARAAERYAALLEVGRSLGVVPQLELWGFSKSLSRLGELMFVAVESGHPDACVLPDVYHIYKGGSPFTGLQLIGGAAMHVFHINDYPAQPPREQISDADRVYPGDGVAPLSQILQTLDHVGFRGMLSLELFNREYWKQDALEVARTGLAKSQAALAQARQ